MKKYKVFSVGSIILNVILISGILFYLMIFKIDANKVYNNSIQSIVEVKAVKEDIGESFGTGEIVKSDGTIITKIIMKNLKDTRLNSNCVKMSYIRTTSEGKVEIHYIWEKAKDVFFDFKFK